MTWLCKNCGKGNIFWRNTCSRCGHPQPGYEATEPDLLEYAEYIFQKVPVPTPPHPVLPPNFFDPPLPYDCGCPAGNYVCNSSACPRGVTITS